ncbi:MAG TPA: hypothetical protein VK427_23560 [Kofleriaceae bacterium]|nr:hypothetical protein [Kofleriaceae bacterium]
MSASIAPDTVSVWTSERALTRFTRGGERSTIVVPFSPLDARGTMHHDTHDGLDDAELCWCGRDIVLVHAELAAWCSSLASLAFEDAP